MIRSIERIGSSRIARMSAVALTLTWLSPLPSNSGQAPTSKTQKMLTLTLHRLRHSRHGTFGVLLVNGEKPVYTLEETELQIPPGIYPVELTYSPKFHRLLPLLIVPHRSAIRIHAGNWPRDSSGCILVGLVQGNTMIGRSLEALDPLIQQIQEQLSAHGDVQIEVVGS